ncbi:hypothetical protein D3C72_1734380 [compost metagenome]
MLVFVDGREVDRTQALNAGIDALEFLLGLGLAGALGQGGQHPLQIIAICLQLLLERLASHAQALPIQTLLL